jgi:hypothetical protein
LSSKNGPVQGQKWETCRWTLEQTLLHIVCHSRNITIIRTRMTTNTWKPAAASYLGYNFVSS